MPKVKLTEEVVALLQAAAASDETPDEVAERVLRAALRADGETLVIQGTPYLVRYDALRRRYGITKSYCQKLAEQVIPGCLPPRQHPNPTRDWLVPDTEETHRLIQARRRRRVRLTTDNLDGS